MSTSVTKQGILLADGVEIGENLLLNSLGNITTGWTQDGSTLSVVGNAFKVVFSGSGNNRIYQVFSGQVWVNNQVYTVSFDAKSESDGFIIRCSRSGVANDQTSAFTLTTNWKHYVGSITSHATVTGGTLTINSYNGSAPTSGTAYLKNIKLEKGTTATPWTPAPTDDIYVGDHGFFEGSDKGSVAKGYMEGNEFYEI